MPYGDFTVEYPPLALPVFVAPAVVTSTAAAYLLAFKLLMTAFGLVVVFATAWSLARLQADRSQTILGLGTIAVAPLLLGHVFLNRYDPWPAALVSLAIAAYLAHRAGAGSALLAASFAAKIFTAAMLPVVAWRILSTRGRKELTHSAAIFVAVCLAVFSYFLVTSFGGLGFSYWTQASRELHGESLAGSVLLALDTIGLYDATIVPGDPGSLDLEGRLPSVLASLTTLLAAAAILWIWVTARRALASDVVFVTALAATAVAFLALAKVLSPQFLTWLLPLIPLLAGRAGRVAGALLLVAMALTQLELYGWEGLHVDSWAAWTLLARNLLLVILLLVVSRELKRLARVTTCVTSPERSRANRGAP